jgi:hypothetical protein
MPLYGIFISGAEAGGSSPLAPTKWHFSLAKREVPFVFIPIFNFSLCLVHWAMHLAPACSLAHAVCAAGGGNNNTKINLTLRTMALASQRREARVFLFQSLRPHILPANQVQVFCCQCALGGRWLRLYNLFSLSVTAERCQQLSHALVNQVRPVSSF